MSWNKIVTRAAMPFLVGLSAFFLIVGPRVLMPDNIAWLDTGDPATYYLGWQFFRNSDWSFPTGLNPDYGLELSNAIVFSDSNPLLAFVFKPFSALLPETFQYFGIWLLACFVLQAGFAWKLVGLVSKHPAMRFLGTGLLVFAPPMIMRLGGHFNLAGHFLILAALYLSLRPTRHLRVALWTFVLVAAALVNAYLLAMIAVLWLADLIQVLVRHERSAKSVTMEFAGILAMVGLACWQSGYFTVGKGVSSDGYGSYRINLLSILDSNGWSYVLNDLPSVGGEGEGFNYLGLGVIFLTFFALFALITGRVGLSAVIKRRAILLGALVGLFLFALSNKIGIGPLEIELPLPEFLLWAANSFRSSGRMFWPVFYMIVLTAIFITVRANQPRTAISLLAIALTIQVIDTRAGWQGIRNKLMTQPATEWATPLKDPFWAQAASIYEKVRWIPSGNISPHWKTLAAYAVRHGLGTDAVYLNRVDRKTMEIAYKNALVILDTGRYEADSLYVLDPNILRSAALHLDPETDLLARIDGFNLVAPAWKRCRECSHVDSELRLADVLPAVEVGERIQFSKSEGGTAYLATGWFPSESWGTWSNGLTAEVILPLADDDVQAILIEANALVSPAHPKQDIKITVNDILAATVRLTVSSANRIRIPIPETALGRLQNDRDRALRLEFQCPDAVRPQDIQVNDDSRSLALGLLAITLI